MRIEEAKALRDALNAQAITNCSFAADGKTPLTFKLIVTDAWKNGSAKVDGYSVKAVELVEKRNLLSGLPFWIDRDTPTYLDPSCDAYYD